MLRFILGILIFLPLGVSAQTFEAQELLPNVSITFSPPTGTFIEGSTFQVPILLDTKGLSVNTINLRVRYDKDRLSVIRPSGDQSIIGLWIEPPFYDNTQGIAEYVGVIPNGIVTSSGVIGTLTFTARETGVATVSLLPDSEVLYNYGLATKAVVEGGRAQYTITPRPPKGLSIYSDTHPIQSEWSNNNSPAFYWDPVAGASGYSVVLDTIPTTVPDSVVNTTETVQGYENLKDGLWYFHSKALKNGVWGETGHYVVRIDTTPPASFTPTVEYLLAATVVVERALVSFITTDNLSGIARYEVGVIDKSETTTEAPVFVETQSPFQVPASSHSGSRVIVRAIDRAGNVQEASIDLSTPSLLGTFIKEYGVYILALLLLALIMWSVLHFLFAHHVVARFKRVMELLKKEEKAETNSTVTSGELSEK